MNEDELYRYYVLYRYSDEVLRNIMNTPIPVVITTGHTAPNYSQYVEKTCRDIRGYTTKAIQSTLYDIDWDAFNSKIRLPVIRDIVRRLKNELEEIYIECDRLWHTHAPQMPNTKYGQFGKLDELVSGIDEMFSNMSIEEINRYNEISSLESRTAGASSCYSCANMMVQQWLLAMAKRYPEFQEILRAYKFSR